MGTLVRLRVDLADEPGALARLAEAIAGQGGNIVGIDVHRSEGGRVVDDVTVDFTDDPSTEDLRLAVSGHGSAVLLSRQAASPRDPVVAALGHAATVASLRERRVGQDQLDAVVVAAVGELCAAPVVWLGCADDEPLHPAGAMALERAGAVVERASDLPDGAGEVLGSEAWLLAVPDATGRIVYAARAAARFTATETARVESMMALAAPPG